MRWVTVLFGVITLVVASLATIGAYSPVFVVPYPQVPAAVTQVKLRDAITFAVSPKLRPPSTEGVPEPTTAPARIDDVKTVEELVAWLNENPTKVSEAFWDIVSRYGFSVPQGTYRVHVGVVRDSKVVWITLTWSNGFAGAKFGREGEPTVVAYVKEDFLIEEFKRFMRRDVAGLIALAMRRRSDWRIEKLAWQPKVAGSSTLALIPAVALAVIAAALGAGALPAVTIGLALAPVTPASLWLTGVGLILSAYEKTARHKTLRVTIRETNKEVATATVLAVLPVLLIL